MSRTFFLFMKWYSQHVLSHISLRALLCIYRICGMNALMLEAFVEWKNRFLFMNAKTRLRHFPGKRNSAEVYRERDQKFFVFVLKLWKCFVRQQLSTWILDWKFCKSQRCVCINRILLDVSFNFLTQACLFMLDFSPILGQSIVPKSFSLFVLLLQ